MFGMHAYTAQVMAAEAHAAELHESRGPHTGLRHALGLTRKRSVSAPRSNTNET